MEGVTYRLQPPPPPPGPGRLGFSYVFYMIGEIGFQKGSDSPPGHSLLSDRRQRESERSSDAETCGCL